MGLKVSICASCGGAFAASLDICYACFKAAKASTRPGGAEWQAQANDNGSDADPPFLAARDFAQLERLARLRLRPGDPASAALLAKLDEARIMLPDEVGPNAAGLNSRVVFSVGNGPPESRVLVLPEDYSPAGWTLPVTSSRGVALLGHVAGTIVVAQRGDGLNERLHLLVVSPQPGAGGTLSQERAETRLRSGSALQA